MLVKLIKFPNQKITFESFLCGIPARDYINQYTPYDQQIKDAAEMIRNAEYVLIGAGAGMSTAAGAQYGGKFFEAGLWAGIVVYVISLVYYCLLFKRSYEQSLKLLEISYDEDMRGDLRFVKNCFLGALSVGISALVFVVFRLGNLCYSIFTCLYTLYYIYLAICVINYRIRAGYILKVVTTDKAPEEPAEEVVENIPEDSAQVAENELAEALERWVDKKHYTRNDLTVEEIAAELGTTQVMLRWYFTNRVGTTFRTWRQSLRLTEAKRLLRYEDVPTSTVHILAGVADKSNFHKLFRREVGMTPQEYRDKYNTLPGHQEESQDL